MLGEGYYKVILFLFIYIGVACTLPIKGGEFVDDKENSEHITPPVTVWVHGSGTALAKFFRPKFFYSLPGLHKATELDPKYHYRRIADSLSVADSDHFPLETFYFFGWSGSISFKVRKKAAVDLYESLQNLSDDYYRVHGQKPSIKIITHSHGGNVALGGDSDFNFPKKSDMEISQLILLACPVQVRTEENSKNGLFHDVISLCSNELLQILDPQGLYRKTPSLRTKKIPLFSKRFFTRNENIIQAKLTMDDHRVSHMQFISPSFLHHLPVMLETLKHDDYHGKLLALNIEKATGECTVRFALVRKKRMHKKATTNKIRELEKKREQTPLMSPD
ncbi:MAG: hypothetical protein Q8Q25_00750 [bacterium]|nr:hypothetical protein [bacterium]